SCGNPGWKYATRRTEAAVSGGLAGMAVRRTCLDCRGVSAVAPVVKASRGGCWMLSPPAPVPQHRARECRGCDRERAETYPCPPQRLADAVTGRLGVKGSPGERRDG